MNLPSKIVSLLGAIDLEGSKVVRRERFIFLCGGAASHDPSAPTSLRQLLLPPAGPILPFPDFTVLLAENAAAAFAKTSFDDLLEHEQVISAIADAVILIVESPGSLCELGAFVKIDEIAKKLIIVMQGKYLRGASFVTKGALRHHEIKYGREPLGYEWETDNLGIVHCEEVVKNSLIEGVNKEVTEVAKSNRTSRFENHLVEHRAFLVLLACFLLRAPSITEVDKAVEVMGVSMKQSEIRNLLEVLIFSKLVYPAQDGKQTFYVPKVQAAPLRVSFKKGLGVSSLSRVAAEINSELDRFDVRKLQMFRRHNGS
ncbi:retron St85 family effector protein [Franzmannia qiaohouensis]|uniref:Retron St85 family effector protein n=1 Tax=Franzmannia qiaohouensis TaxID=1329370 RepID=A0ABU1HK49_9GAMM|nr:retron St85 family effector protein [Halomonas qiaohouensis]MDR5907869.1 retron St85 family effector protein [Halomonas qiaohouensis]